MIVLLGLIMSIVHVIVWPQPPVMMTNEADRAAYVAENYWRGLDYNDTTWIADTAALNKAFADWMPLLAQLPPEQRSVAAASVVSFGHGHPAMQLRLAEMAEEYFNQPNSTYRNEELYIPILQALVADTRIDNIYKERYSFQLSVAMRNRQGSKATDFEYITSKGQTKCLSDIKAEYTLLYFLNPDCNACRATTDYIRRSQVLTAVQGGGLLTVLAVYPDEDLKAWQRNIGELPSEWILSRYAKDSDRKAYDLPAIPCLYLLDKDKNVILKDAPIELIEAWIARMM